MTRSFASLSALALLGAVSALSTAGCPGSAPAPTPPPSASSPPPEEEASAPPPAAEAGAAPDAAAGDAAPPKRDAAKGDAGAPEGMLFVPGGTFKMGADEGGEGDERPAHDVTVASFWLDRTEVTQAAYEECVAAGACKPPSQPLVDSFGGLFRGPNKPIIGVSWFDGRDYCAWKHKRLPREAEFERAVRGDDSRRFPWGNEPPDHERTVFSTNSTDDVGSHPKGKGPYGHDDLAGNVWEWMEDDYDPFAYARPSAPEGKPASCDEIVAAQNKLRKEGKQGFTGTNPIPDECEKSIRGGAYNYPAYGLRSTNRVHHPGRYRLRMTGFRCALDAT